MVQLCVLCAVMIAETRASWPSDVVFSLVQRLPECGITEVTESTSKAPHISTMAIMCPIISSPTAFLCRTGGT